MKRIKVDNEPHKYLTGNAEKVFMRIPTPTVDDRAAARRVLERMGADDIADMLGLADA